MQMAKTFSIVFLWLARILGVLGVLLIFLGELTYLFTHPDFWQAARDIWAEYDPYNLVSFFTRLLFLMPAGIAYLIHLGFARVSRKEK